MSAPREDLGPLDSLRRVAVDARALSPRELAAALLEGFREHDLLIEAGAIAFRAFLALLTGTLCVLGFLGFLGLGELYAREAAPPLQDSLSQPAFRLIDDAVSNVLREANLFWMTAGAVLATWEISAVLRATGQVLNRMYGIRDERPLLREVLSTMAAGVLIALLLVAALAAVRLGSPAIDSLLGRSPLVDAVSLVVRWGLAVALLLASLGIVARIAPAPERPLRWVSFGAFIVVAGWIATSVLFRLYVTELASFSSVFGHLATAFIFAEYLFLVAVVFLGGLLVDAVVERRA